MATANEGKGIRAICRGIHRRTVPVAALPVRVAKPFKELRQNRLRKKSDNNVSSAWLVLMADPFVMSIKYYNLIN
jgi:hypothetical protein